MSDVLSPILDAAGDPLRYANRDFRGVETPAASPATRRGWNAEATYTERLDKAIGNEHASAGYHYTIKIALATIFHDTPDADSHSEDRGTIHGDSTRYTVANPSAGVYTITLTSALPSSTLEVVGLNEDENDPAGDYVRIFLKQITSTTVWQVERWAGKMGTMAKADGEVLVTVRTI